MTTYALKNLQFEKTQKILLVDDDPPLLELVGLFLESFGYEYITATDGVEAVKNLHKYGDIDIVITDMIMPNMDGMELLKYTRQHFPTADVIIITGHTEVFSYTDVISEGAIDFISKPFSKNELDAKLKRVIRERLIIHELERRSTSDSLTGLFNRRYFDEKLMEETHRADRQGYGIFLALIDIDRFKQYNDTFGHQEGDKVLQAVGETILLCIRKNVDWGFRIGGDEFAIIIPQTLETQVRDVAGRIMKKMEEKKFAKIGVSIGLARFKRLDGRTLEQELADLMRRADAALYAAKNSGRNKAVINGQCQAEN